MTIKDILIKAKTILDEKGWCQGKYVHSDGRVCLSESIQQAGGVIGNGGAYYMPIGGEALEAHRYLQDFLGRTVYRWNDDANRTKSEVLALLDDAIAKRVALGE